MSGTTINVLDASVLTILALSAVVAFFRGFLREFLSLVAWVGAAVLTLYLYPHSVDFMKQHVSTKDEHIIGAGGAIGTYILSFIVISIFSSILIRYLKTGMEVGILDNFLGLLFGALRGLFIVSLGYLILTTVISKDNPPEWMTTSFTKPYLQQGSDILVRIAPEYLSDIEGFVKKESEERRNNKDNDPDSIINGYKPDNQKSFDRLIDSGKP